MLAWGEEMGPREFEGFFAINQGAVHNNLDVSTEILESCSVRIIGEA
jgi:hypothetical protein